jgi:hypothetical protein
VPKQDCPYSRRPIVAIVDLDGLGSLSAGSPTPAAREGDVRLSHDFATPVNDIGERQEKRGIRMVWRIGVSEARLRDAPERVGQIGEDIGRYQDRQLFGPDKQGMAVDVAQAQKHDPPTKGLPDPQGLRGDPGPERRHGLARASVPLRARP